MGRAFRVFQELTQIPPSVRKRLGSGGVFAFDGRFAFSNFENWGGRHNAHFNHWVEACRTANCVFDVGAHIGLTAMPAARELVGRGVVCAFEPGSDNLKYLRRHLCLNNLSNVEVVEALVGDEEAQEVVLFELPGDSGLNTTAPGYLNGPAGGETKIQVTLDEFCRVRGITPDVIKIDVEGAELGVLRGASAVLRRHHPTIFLSVHPRQIEALGGSVEELLDMINNLGYVVLNEHLDRVERLGFAEYQLINIEKYSRA